MNWTHRLFLCSDSSGHVTLYFKYKVVSVRLKPFHITNSNNEVDLCASDAFMLCLCRSIFINLDRWKKQVFTITGNQKPWKLRSKLTSNYD